jgi:hypothetical protein
MVASGDEKNMQFSAFSVSLSAAGVKFISHRVRKVRRVFSFMVACGEKEICSSLRSLRALTKWA